MKTRTFAAIGAALIVGFLGGSLHGSIPTTRTPVACTAMAAHADEIAHLWNEVTIAVNDRGDALDPETYAIHDAEFRHLDESLVEVEGKYETSKRACVGESR